MSFLDNSGDIILDADGANITMKDGGTTVLDFVFNGATDATTVLTITITAPTNAVISRDKKLVVITSGRKNINDK